MATGDYSLTKLVNFMGKIVPDGDGVTFFDDGKNLILQMAAADSLSATAILPSMGKGIEPVTLRRIEFLKAYRQGAKLSGSDGRLNLAQSRWKMTLVGAVEAHAPEPFIVDGKQVVADVTPLKSVPTEDNYGGSTWAMFLPSGIAALTTTYSLVAVAMAADAWPTKAISMQANAIFPLINLTKPTLTVNEDVVGIIGKFAV